MHCHPNARRTPRGRTEVFRLVEQSMTVTAACLAAPVSRRFYYRWLPRWRAAGEAGLVDRSSRPRSSPHPLSAAQEAHIAGLRVSIGWGPDRLAALVGLAGLHYGPPGPPGHPGASALFVIDSLRYSCPLTRGSGEDSRVPPGSAWRYGLQRTARTVRARIRRSKMIDRRSRYATSKASFAGRTSRR